MMVAFLEKRGILIGLAILAIALALGFVASFIAGQRLSNLSIKQTLEDVTGRRVIMPFEPVIAAYPALSAEFKDISFHNWGYASDNAPVLKAPKMRLTFSVFAALTGHTRVTSVSLESPEFRAFGEDGVWQLPFGNQSQRGKTFAGLEGSGPEGPNAEALSAILENAPGTITISNGTVVLGRAPSQTISNVNGALTWLKGQQQSQFSAEGIWRQKAAKLEISTDDIVTLVQGADANIDVGFYSDPIEARFSGITRLLPSPYFEGNVFAKSASLLAATQWQGLSTPFDFAAFGLTLAGVFKGDTEKWQLEEGQLQLGTNKGTGGLTYQPKMSPPALSGTLDFANLDLGLLSQIFELSPGSKGTSASNFSTDLRISADVASFGAFSLNKVAASLQVSTQSNALDIHNAAGFGGTLQLSLKRPKNSATQLRILAENIDTQTLSKISPVFLDVPQTKGSISAILEGTDVTDPRFVETARGTIKLRLNGGTIAGFSADQLVRELRKGGFFALKPQAPAMLSFTGMDAEATLEQGTLQFDPLRVDFDQAALSLTGAYAIKGESIALTGTVDLAEGHPEAINGPEQLKVFFGGSRKEPLMSGLK